MQWVYALVLYLLVRWNKKWKLKHKLPKKDLVSAKCLELTIIIASYNTILEVIWMLGFTMRIIYLKFLILLDNKPSDSWARRLVFASIIRIIL